MTLCIYVKKCTEISTLNCLNFIKVGKYRHFYSRNREEFFKMQVAVDLSLLMYLLMPFSDVSSPHRLIYLKMGGGEE